MFKWLKIGRHRRRPTVDATVKALRAEDPSARMAAADILGRLGDKRAVEPLARALGDKVWEVNRAIAVALGQLGDSRGVGLLAKARLV